MKLQSLQILFLKENNTTLRKSSILKKKTAKNKESKQLKATSCKNLLAFSFPWEKRNKLKTAKRDPTHKSIPGEIYNNQKVNPKKKQPLYSTISKHK